MKKILYLIAAMCVLGSTSAFAQLKTSFTQETRPEDSLPTGMASNDVSKEMNAKDVKMPSKTRGIERYQKMNVFGQAISDDFLLYRGVLNERQKVVYDQVYKALMENETIVNLQAKTSSSELEEALDAVRYDNPECYWWAGAYTWWSNSDGIATKVRLNLWMDQNQVEDSYEDFWCMTVPIIYYASCLDDDMEKIKYVHDYICLSTEYDYPSYYAGKTGGKLQTAYSCAVEYKTVCAGYSQAFVYYMQQLGIPCVSVWGSGHQWNMLKVNGQYYQMDVTWDDTQLIPTYYNLTHSEMQRIESHTPTDLAKKIINKFPSSGSSMSYVNYFGMLQEGSPYTYQELGNYDYTLATQLSNKIYKETPRKINLISTESDFQKLLVNALNNTSGSAVTVQFATKNSGLYNQIYNDLGRSSDLANSIYRAKSWARGFSTSYNYKTMGDYTIVDITVTLR